MADIVDLPTAQRRPHSEAGEPITDAFTMGVLNRVAEHAPVFLILLCSHIRVHRPELVPMIDEILVQFDAADRFFCQHEKAGN